MDIIEALADFPVAMFDALQLSVGRWDAAYRARNNNEVSDVWREFARAGNAVKVRWRDLAQADDLFSKTVVLGRPTPEEVYLEESTLFSFFYNALSLVELTFFHLYAVGAMLDARFTLLPTKPDKVTPGETRVAFEKFFKGEPVTIVLAKLQRDARLEKLKTLRNVLSHRGTPTCHLEVKIDLRGAPGLEHFLGGPKGAPAVWKDFGVTVEPALTKDNRAWLSGAMAEIVPAACDLADAKIP